MTAEPPSEILPEPLAPASGGAGKRRMLIIALIALLLAFAAVAALFVRYVINPAPLPDLLPAPVNLSLPPHYVFSIYELSQPVGIALSPDGQRVYVAESGGERQVKIFNPDGRLLGSFAPPATATPERSPVYLDVDPRGRVYVSDRAQHAVFIYDAEGAFLDAILSPSLTLSEYLAKHLSDMPAGTQISYNLTRAEAAYQRPGEEPASLPAPDYFDWAPLGVRIDPFGRLAITDVASQRSAVYIFPSNVISAENWTEFSPYQALLGEFGSGAAQFNFPNSVAVDSRGRIFVADSNNSRISVWDAQGTFLFHFGRGSGAGAVNLPRGMAVDGRDRLYVVDAVAQGVKVYDVSGEQIEFLFAFGDLGIDDGLFNYPNDIAIDSAETLYVVDRENQRVQVWKY
ncbi:MAG: NHL repeat-containing protein [Chloroflexi bacterium]|nr:NHL repeat-containing protein [Chloroflexota bacterium]